MGKPLFVRAIESVKLEGTLMKYSFIVRQEHIDKYGIDKSIKELLPEANVFPCNVLLAALLKHVLWLNRWLPMTMPSLWWIAILSFESPEYRRLISEALLEEPDKARGGALVSFESNLPKYSYAEIDENTGLVKRTAEKEVISSHALCGAYFFSSGREFKSAAHRLLDEPVMQNPEFYVSLLYNYLLQDGSPVYLANMNLYKSYGTPEELALYSGAINSHSLWFVCL